MIRSPRLRQGATLGVIATSSPIDKAGGALVERGYERLREKGFKIVEAPNCRSHRGHAAGTILERVDALHAFFGDPDIDGIISFWGGCRLTNFWNISTGISSPPIPNPWWAIAI